MSCKYRVHKKSLAPSLLTKANGEFTAPAKTRSADFDVGVVLTEGLEEGFDDWITDRWTVGNEPWNEHPDHGCVEVSEEDVVSIFVVEEGRRCVQFLEESGFRVIERVKHIHNIGWSRASYREISL